MPPFLYYTSQFSNQTLFHTYKKKKKTSIKITFFSARQKYVRYRIDSLITGKRWMKFKIYVPQSTVSIFG